MEPSIQKQPVWCNARLDMEERVRYFNLRPHPADMTPDQRWEEFQALGAAQIPLVMFQTRLRELGGSGLDHIQIAKGWDQIGKEAFSGVYKHDTVRLEQITVEMCQAKPRPPLGKLIMLSPPFYCPEVDPGIVIRSLKQEAAFATTELRAIFTNTSATDGSLADASKVLKLFIDGFKDGRFILQIEDGRFVLQPTPEYIDEMIQQKQDDTRRDCSVNYIIENHPEMTRRFNILKDAPERFLQDVANLWNEVGKLSNQCSNNTDSRGNVSDNNIYSVYSVALALEYLIRMQDDFEATLPVCKRIGGSLLDVVEATLPHKLPRNIREKIFDEVLSKSLH